MAPVYRATFKVSSHNLGKILDLGCELVSVTPEAKGREDSVRPIGRFRTSTTSSRLVVVEYLKKHPHSDRRTLLEVITSAGYSKNTISPALSELNQHKKIVRHSDGTFSAR